MEQQASGTAEAAEKNRDQGKMDLGRELESMEPESMEPGIMNPENTDPENMDPENEKPGNTDSDIMNRYAARTMEKRKLQAREKIVNQELEELERRVTDIFAENGWTSVATEGGTVYLHREVFARLAKDERGGYDEAHRALEASGLGYMVKGSVNTQSLRAYVREREEYEEEIPPEAARWIIKTEMFRARVKAKA